MESLNLTFEMREREKPAAFDLPKACFSEVTTRLSPMVLTGAALT